MGLIEQYTIQLPARKRGRPQQTRVVRRKSKNAAPSAQWFERLIDERLICGVRSKDKLKAFIRLCDLSIKGFAKPNSEVLAEVKGAGDMPALEIAARYKIERNKILNDVRDKNERKILDYYACFDTDVLRDIEFGFIKRDDVKSALNSALLDIVRANDRRRPILTVITSVWN